MRDDQKGVLAIISACTIWGLSPLYFAQVAHVPPVDVLSYRCIWALVFFVAILAEQGRLSEVRAALSGRQIGLIFVASLMISANWFVFIYAIATGQGIEASLGYYIFPLFAVVLGMMVFGEVLRRAQWVAVALAAIGVLVLTIGLGVAPWIAFVLAGTFAAYGTIKKQLPLGPVVSVTAEVMLLAPLAIIWIIFMGAEDTDLATHGVLALSGPLTATPLILFSFAARRVRLATLGIVQYLNPTLQFGCAALIMGEVVTRWHMITFPIIWAGLVIYTVSVWRQDKAARKPDVSAGTSSAT